MPEKTLVVMTFNFDVFHYYQSSVSLEEIAATPVERLGVIHVNDSEDLPKEELNDFKRLYPTLGALPAGDVTHPVRSGVCGLCHGRGISTRVLGQ